MNMDDFVKEVLAYIDANIIGKPGTHIIGHGRESIVANRGHAIQTIVEVPEDLAETMRAAGLGTGVGPVFYAEELLEQYPRCDAAAAALAINRTINEDYGNMLTVFREQSAAMGKTIDDYGPSELFIMALPACHAHPAMRKGCITKELPEAGLVLTMKGLMCKNPSNEDQSYFSPIKTENGRDATDDEWYMAAVNSLGQAALHIECIPVQEHEGGEIIPVCGTISDQKQFYEWFYLIQPECVWGHFAETHSIDTICIIPKDAYTALFIVNNEKTASCEQARMLQDIFLGKIMEIATAADVMPCAIDCRTWEIKPVAAT